MSIFFRIILILMGFAAVFFLLQGSLMYTSIFIGFIVLLFIVELYFYQKNAFLFYDKTINAILSKDFSADFSKHKSFQNYHRLKLLSVMIAATTAVSSLKFRLTSSQQMESRLIYLKIFVLLPRCLMLSENLDVRAESFLQLHIIQKNTMDIKHTGMMEHK